MFEAGTQAGEDVFAPKTLLPLYLRGLIWALTALMVLYAAFCVVSLIRCVSSRPHKTALRYAGIAAAAVAAAAVALALLVIIYLYWFFAVNYGFRLMGCVPAALSWAFMALSAGHLALSVVAAAKKSLSRGAGGVHITAAVLMVLLAAEFVISGFIRI